MQRKMGTLRRSSGPRARPGVVLLVATLVIGLGGCSPKARVLGDPFRRSNAPSSIPNDPRYDPQSNLFDRANESAREGDYSVTVPTSPAAEQARQKEPTPFVPTGRPSSDPTDPFLGDKTTGPAIAPTDPAPSGESRFAQYESIRKRLDQAGAANFRSEKNEATGETTFSCELPYPDNPSMFRVFESTSLDEQKAMLAVTDLVEQWIAEHRQTPR